jgi:phosphatidylinositol-3-phosphatase
LKAMPWFCAAAACLLLVSCGTGYCGDPPRYDHIVIVIEENKSGTQLDAAPWMASLKAGGASMARFYAEVHPSQPNYIVLFSGSLRGVADDNQYDIDAPNLASSLIYAGLTFAIFSEGLPSPGDRVFISGRYVRKHNPSASFTNAPDSVNLPFTRFPSDYTRLPTVSFVIPNLDNDMHDGSVAQGDVWLQTNLAAYAQWALTHNSLLVVTFDEPDPAAPAATTPIYTVFYGAEVTRTVSWIAVNHYSLLRLLDEIYGLPFLGEEAQAQRILGIWN